MCKPMRVILGPNAYNWLSRHRYVSEHFIISAVESMPMRKLIHEGDDFHSFETNKKKNGDFIRIKIYVETRNGEYYVNKIHSGSLRH